MTGRLAADRLPKPLLEYGHDPFSNDQQVEIEVNTSPDRRFQALGRNESDATVPAEGWRRHRMIGVPREPWIQFVEDAGQEVDATTCEKKFPEARWNLEIDDAVVQEEIVVSLQCEPDERRRISHDLMG